jgi:2-haloacid dehalogenase
MSQQRSVVIFDLGGVLIDWNPRYLYRKLFNGDDAAMEHFLANVCTGEWNIQQDAGRSLAEAYAQLTSKHPDKKHLIEAWGERFDEMMSGQIEGTVAILEELYAKGVPLYALTNWSAETFPHGLKRFEFFKRFRGIVVSGELKLIKPDRRIFQHLLDTYDLKAQDAVFIDDALHNVAGAAALGIHGIHFTGPALLRQELTELKLL